jgi:hypothetical protein
MSRASAGGTATRPSPRLGCLTASSPVRRPLLVGFWGLVAVMSGSGPMHRRCLTMLIDAVNRSRSAPSTGWRTTPTGRDVTALRFSGPICAVCQRAQRRPSGPRLRLRGVRGVGINPPLVGLDGRYECASRPRSLSTTPIRPSTGCGTYLSCRRFPFAGVDVASGDGQNSMDERDLDLAVPLGVPLDERAGRPRPVRRRRSALPRQWVVVVCCAWADLLSRSRPRAWALPARPGPPSRSG